MNDSDQTPPSPHWNIGRRGFIAAAGANLLPALLPSLSSAWAQGAPATSQPGAFIGQAQFSPQTLQPIGDYAFIQQPSGYRIPFIASTGTNAYTPIIACCGALWFFCRSKHDNFMHALVYSETGEFLQDIPLKTALPAYTPGFTSDHGIYLITANLSNNSFTFSYSNGVTESATMAALCLPTYQPTLEDVQFVMSYLNVSLTAEEAASLVAQLPPMSCCSLLKAMNSGLPSTAKFVRNDWTLSMTAGALVAGTLMGIAGGIFGGPYLFVVGFAIGAQFGAGATMNLSIPAYTVESVEGSLTSVVLNGLTGPYSKSSHLEDIWTYYYPRYGQLDYAGALAKAQNPDVALVYYPTDQIPGRSISLSNPKPRPDIPPMKILSGTSTVAVYKYIFVIVETATGSGAYQVRIQPEAIVSARTPANQRPNHSQLTSGSRLLSLFGDSGEDVFGAGELYIANNQIIGYGTRTGHYFSSFLYQDQVVLQNLEACLQALGYDLSAVKCSGSVQCGDYLVTPGNMPDVY